MNFKNLKIKFINFWFEYVLTRDQKRVFIARDVLKQIEANCYIPTPGNYLNHHFEYVNDRAVLGSEDIKKTFDSGKAPKCQVCLIGSLLLSVSRQRNILSFNDITNSIYRTSAAKTHSLIKDLFTDEELYLLETAFEGESAVGARLAKKAGREINKSKISHLIIEMDKFSSEHDNTERIQIIMNHIIDNNGEIIFEKIR